jgi:hypothetical protein
VRPSNPLHQAKAHGLSLVPPSAPVAASNQLGAYVSARRYVYVFPFIRNARWIIIDVHNPAVVSPAAYQHAVRTIDSNPRWRPTHGGG